MGDIVDLHGQLALLEDDELIENLARFADGTLSEAVVKARHHLTNEDWAMLGESDRLVELVEAQANAPGCIDQGARRSGQPRSRSRGGGGSLRNNHSA